MEGTGVQLLVLYFLSKECTLMLMDDYINRTLSQWPGDCLASKAKWFAVRQNESTDLADGVISATFFPHDILLLGGV